MAAIKEWLVELYREMDKNSPHELFGILRGTNRNEDLTVPVVNNAKEFLKVVFPVTQGMAMAPQEVNEGKVALYLYYKLLLAIIKDLMMTNDAGKKFFSDVETTRMMRLGNSLFHNALLCCSAEIVSRAFQRDEFPKATQRAGRMLTCVDVWMVGTYILESNVASMLPPGIHALLVKMNESILLKHCFVHHSSIYTYLIEGGGCLHLPGEYTMVEKFLIAFGHLVFSLARDIADSIATDLLPTDMVGCFVRQCLDLLDLVMLHHLNLFFERNIFVPILCSVFCVGKLFETSMTFQQLMYKVALLFPDIHRLTIFARVLISKPSDNPNDLVFEKIYRFYNEIFLLTCKEDIVEMRKALSM